MRFNRFLNEHAGQAQKGGQTGMNDYFYKGGQFLPSTKAEPGKWKIGKKWVKTGKELIEPNKFEIQPTPLSRSIYVLLSVGAMTKMEGKKIEFNPDMRDNSPDRKIKPGVKGIVGKKEYTLKELIDQYNKGSRWVEVEPEKEISIIRYDKGK